jgi:hypothetical protein
MRAVDETISLTVGRAEALVLFEMLADFRDQRCLEIHDPAERLALVRLHGALEGILLEPFKPEYRALVDEARSSLTAQSGGAYD